MAVLKKDIRLSLKFMVEVHGENSYSSVKRKSGITILENSYAIVSKTEMA